MIIRIVQNIQRINKEGNAPLYISFYLGKEKVVIPCKLSVPTTKFDSKTGRSFYKESQKDSLLAVFFYFTMFDYQYFALI